LNSTNFIRTLLQPLAAAWNKTNLSSFRVLDPLFREE